MGPGPRADPCFRGLQEGRGPAAPCRQSPRPPRIVTTWTGCPAQAFHSGTCPAAANVTAPHLPRTCPRQLIRRTRPRVRVSCCRPETRVQAGPAPARVQAGPAPNPCSGRARTPRPRPAAVSQLELAAPCVRVSFRGPDTRCANLPPPTRLSSRYRRSHPHQLWSPGLCQLQLAGAPPRVPQQRLPVTQTRSENPHMMRHICLRCVPQPCLRYRGGRSTAGAKLPTPPPARSAGLESR